MEQQEPDIPLASGAVSMQPAPQQPSSNHHVPAAENLQAATASITHAADRSSRVTLSPKAPLSPIAPLSPTVAAAPKKRKVAVAPKRLAAAPKVLAATLSPKTPLSSVSPMKPTASLAPVLPTVLSQEMNGAATAAATLPEETIQVLRDQGYTRGLAEALHKNKQAFSQSIWIVDNSGSMANRDGHRLVETSSKDHVKLVSCTRWAEIQQTVQYHVQMAALLQSPIVFRLLNDPGRTAGPQQFSICQQGQDINNLDHDLAVAQSTMMNATPSGFTPLIPHLQEIRQQIITMQEGLRRNRTNVALILATDGLPTNENGISDESVKKQFIETLRSLQRLAVWVVVRLCTDDEQTVEFYNSLDDILELSIEVLDDFTNEAQELHKHNPWLNYGLPLHRMRELGFHNKLLDLMDERQLSKDELCDFFRILFTDKAMQSVPDPQADWNGFVQAIDKLNHNGIKTWNPVHKRVESWIDMSSLKKIYGPGLLSWAFRHSH